MYTIANIPDVLVVLYIKNSAPDHIYCLDIAVFTYFSWTISHINEPLKMIVLVIAQNGMIFKYNLLNSSPVVEPLDCFQFLLFKITVRLTSSNISPCQHF